MNSNAPVLRVAQLDTAELDTLLLANIKHSINEDLFRYIQSGLFQRCHPEIFAGLKFLVWYHSFGKHSQTVAQSTLSWTYNFSPNLKIVQKTIHALIFCSDEFIYTRFLKTCAKLFVSNQIETREKLEKLLDHLIEMFGFLVHIVGFLNYVLFIYDGKYLNWWERLLRMRPVYTREQMMRQTDTESTYREELWHAYFGLFRAANSVFNFGKIFEKLKSKMSVVRRAEVVPQANLNLCGICGETPVMAHCSIDIGNEPCEHVFCYLCVKRELSSPEFKCPLCLKIVKDVRLFCRSE